MAITTVDAASSGMRYTHSWMKSGGSPGGAGVTVSTLYRPGYPEAASAPSPGLSGAALTSYAGQLPFINAGVGQTTDLGMFTGSANDGACIMLADRLWHNSGFTITSTGAQTVNSVAWPARDANGSTDGVGVLLGVEVSTATGAATPTITVSYTNSAGTAGRIGTNIIPTISSSVEGQFYHIGLQDGDLGVRSVQTLTLSASWISGVIHLVAYRIIARIAVERDLRTKGCDWVTTAGQQLYDNTVPFILYIPRSAAAPSLTGQVTYTQG